MFKRIGLCLLAASAAYGAAINTYGTTYGTTGAAAAGVADTTGAVTSNVYDTTSTAATVEGASRFTDAELAAAAPAPVYTVCQKPGQFVITFDDGPNPETTPIALQFLREHGIRATFFVNGINYGNLETSQESIDLVKQEFNEGHDIGSHTYYHKDLFEAIAEGTMELNIDKMTDKIQEIIGVKPAFFRPPCGSGAYTETDPERQAMNERVQKYLGASGYNIIMWGTDTRDWDYKSDVDKVIAELNKQLAQPGVSPATHSFISLMHDVHPTTVNLVLPKVVEYVSSLGYTFVPLTECLGLTSAYQPTGNEGLANNLINDPNAAASDVTVVDPNAAATDPNAALVAEETTEITQKSGASMIEAKMIYSTLAVILSLFFLF